MVKRKRLPSPPPYLQSQGFQSQSTFLQSLRALVRGAVWLQVLADRQFVDRGKVCPEAKASIFSIITFGWISNLMRQGYK